MVEWKKLGEVCEIKTGKGITQKDCSDEYSYPVMSGGQSPMGMYFEFNREANTTTISRVGAYAGFVSFIKEKFYCNDKCFSVIPLKNDVFNSKFLYVVLKHKEESIKKLQSEGGVPTINTKKVGSIFIPIPSLEEQTRIVGILDTFTSAIDNLKEQIAQRRKQYEYYRDQLLDLEGKEGVEMKMLGEVGEICMCKRIMKEQTSDSGDVPFFKIGTFGGKADAYISRELFDEYKAKYSYPQKGEILLSAAGTIGRSVIFDGEDAYYQDSNIVWIANNEKILSNKFLYYYYQVIDWKIDGGTIKRLYNYNLKNAVVPVPSLSEQQRIVSILDTFEASIQNLEAQLKEREKQYEYYRNKLLTFE